MKTMQDTPPEHSGPIEHQLGESVKTRLTATLQKEIKGNIKDSAALTFGSYEGKIYQCHATTHIKISVQSHRETLKGKQSSGKLVSSEEELGKAISKATDLGSDRKAALEIRHILLDRDDKLFAIKDKEFRLKQFSQQYCMHHSCKSCNAQGNTDCFACHGKGQSTCPACRARGHVPCTFCRGTGMRQGARGQTTCTHCQGRKQITCRTCQGRGQTSCGKCGGRGKSTCRDCTGTGWLTESARIECTARIDFKTCGDECPDRLQKVIQQKGQTLYRTENLRLAIESPAESELQSEQSDPLIVNYQAVLPHGFARYSLDGEEFSIELAGNGGIIVNGAPFIELAAKKGLSELVKGAKAPPQQTEKHLNNAKDFRIIREVLIASMKGRPSAALKILRKTYPYGVRSNTLKTLIMAAKKSFKDLSRAARYKGVALGLIIAALVQTFYNFSGLRLDVIGFMPAIQQFLIDTAVFGLGLFLNVLSVDILGKKALIKTIQELTGQKLSLQSVHFDKGKTRIWSLVGNVIVVALIWWLAVMLGFSTKPEWLPF